METTDDSKNFFKYVFNFDDASKSDMLNIIQYTLIAIIPVVSLNKAMQKYVPESDDRKGSIELYYNETCEKFLRLCYVNGSNDYYYPVSESPMTNNKTNDGADYYTYRLRNSITKDFITLQIIYYNPPINRIHYKDDYIEFHE